MIPGSLKERKSRLKALWSSVEQHEQEILDALYTDLEKPEAEALLHEIYPLKKEIQYALKNLRSWMEKRRVPTPLSMIGTRHFVLAEPKGKVLIISPWNFPVLLTLHPLVGALAAGNSIIVKPSEHTPHASKVLKKLLNSAFSEDIVKVVLGGPEVAAGLTASPFNHMCFTGGTSIGRKVMEAATKQLCSVTLELGGKSPVLVDDSANISEAAWKLAFYKFANAGQTCTAPDYILCHESKKDGLVSGLKENFKKFFEGNNNGPSPDYCQIVNETHFDRIEGYLEDAKELGATVAVGGGTDRNNGFIAPTVLCDVSMDSLVMKEEIFGPLMPIITYKNLGEAISFINKRDKPLALYLFSYNKKNQKKLTEETSSGALVFNDCVIHHTNPNLPFGGINNSGLGSYHGKYGFDAFSHEKAILKSSAWSPFKLMLPPYTKRKHALVNMIKKFS